MSWFNAIVHGIFLGGFYALLATGLSLMFGVMRIINLAHGTLALLGAYAAYLLVEHWNVSPYLTLVPILPAAFVFGYVLQRTMLDRSLRSGPLVPLLTTFGLAIVIGNLLLRYFSPDVHSLDPGTIGAKSWQVTSTLSIGAFEALTLGVAILVLGILQVYVSRTGPGRELRACAQDSDTAELVGIDARSVYARATAIAVVTAALAGVFLAMRSTFDPSTGPTELIYAFEAVVIGGLGSLWGTLVGGIVLGVSQTIGAQVNPQYFALFGDLVFLAVLVARAVAESGALGALRRAAA